MAGDPDDHHTAAVGDRGLIEDAVRLLLTGAPAGWTQLHAEFEPASQPPTTTAHVTTSTETQSLPVSAGVASVVAEHQRRAAATGAPWQRLIIDCDAGGVLSARTDPATTTTGTAPAAAATPRPPRRWPRRVLATITLGCLAAAAVVFALGRQWVSPPQADIIAVPEPSPRQQEAFALITQWYDAQNRADAAGMRELVCADPAPNIVDEIKAIEHNGVADRLSFPDGIAVFRDEGAKVWVTFTYRARPLDDYWKAEVDEAQKNTGFFDDDFTLVDEDTVLAICDVDLKPR